MKTLSLFFAALVIGSVTANAGGPGGSYAYHQSNYHPGSYHNNYYHGGYHGDYHHHDDHTSFVFSVGSYPFFPAYYPAYSYPAYPAYAAPAYPAYSYAPTDYSYSRPNYAVTGTLLGALTGGLIGDSIHHQGWEGAGIGAAAGLVLGSLAEHGARTHERASYVAPGVSYAQPAIQDAPTVNNAPVAPAAPQVQSRTAPAGSMNSANNLFGR